jgi:hypothetical protein
MAWNGQRLPVRTPARAVVPAGTNHGLPSRQSGDPVAAVPGIETARLPATYEAAYKAIAKCSRIDECKSWSDKAAALASYARQAKDQSLCVMAERIHARAVRRCGELLKQVPSGQGSKNQYGELRDGSVTRQEAARDAGLSERQKVMALRVASVSGAKFEEMIESDAPPNVTRLAEMGRNAQLNVTRLAELGRNLQPPQASIARRDPVRAARADRMFSNIREFCVENDPEELAGVFASQEKKRLREFVMSLDAWLDRFVAHLGGGE